MWHSNDGALGLSFLREVPGRVTHDLIKEPGARTPVLVHVRLQRKNTSYIHNLSFLREFWRETHAHVILTAEADSLPTDARQLLEDYGLVGCHSSKSNDLSDHTRIDSTGYFRLFWESSEEDDKNTHVAIFEMKFCKKAEEAITDSRERTADTPFRYLESVGLTMEGIDQHH